MAIQTDQILRRPQVRAITGLSNSSLDRAVRADQFPAPFKLSPDPRTRAVGWSARAVQAWIADRVASADAEQVAA